MRTPDRNLSGYFCHTASLFFLLMLGVFAWPAKIQARNTVAPRASELGVLVHAENAIPVALRLPASAQDGGPGAAPPAAPATPKPVELPEGDGKVIATEYCQMCHKLTNLTKARKDLDDWKDTIHTMIDRGASIPDDKVDTLAKYLAANFGPKPPTPASPDANAPVVSPPSPAATAPSAPAPAKAVVELPDGDGKAIATENCQACHKLTNLTKAHKSLDDWKDTVQTMIDRGANVPADQVEILVQYLAKNFGPKDASDPAPSPTPAK